MLVPSLFERGLFDDLAFPAMAYSKTNEIMRTDVKDTGSAYEMTVDVPGIKKEDVKIELKDGYIVVNAVTSDENESKDSNGKYLCRERHYGSYSRSFYIGEEVTHDDIKASFENGTLKLTIKKKEQQKLPDNNRYIQID